ncbi:hypothetical protein QF031_002301 [Pseudarthrobacter defluvii]|uniref:DUF2625 family protein n=1 Tax=Pseudarthrobacter defluvii TaxID=410837 RepID=UPI0027808C6E|nr:DUF2625 family protein [Pseudarthrobacter defluvii]MDQ0769552.1 hypothetical protein [Pseudarthrobacter defluvii]
MTPTRSADELLSVDSPAWPRLNALLASSSVDFKVVPADETAKGNVLFRLQVTAASTLGAIASNCGALVVDHGWVRILGAGAKGMEDIATANALGDPDHREAPPGHLVIAYDVLGGVFAINHDDLPAEPGEVCYWRPDTLESTPLGAGHTAFVEWLLNAGAAEFYRELRWPGWEEEVAALSIDEGISVYPFLFTEEGRNITTAARKAVPFRELLYLNAQMANSLRPESN